MEYISIPDYAKKYDMPENAVRTLASLEKSPYKVRKQGKHTYIADKEIKLLTAIEYAEKYGYTENRVREMTKAENTDLEVYFVGVKAYIKVNEEGEKLEIQRMVEEIATLKEITLTLAKHLGVNLDKGVS